MVWSRLRAVAILTAFLAACGSEEKSYTPVQDTVESKAEIEFDPASDLIRITKPGPEANSAIITPCSIGFERSELIYKQIDPKHFQLGGDTLSFARDLKIPSAVSGVPGDLFVVWSLPSRIVDGITYKIEVEIQATAMIYRNTCSR